MVELSLIGKLRPCVHPRSNRRSFALIRRHCGEEAPCGMIRRCWPIVGNSEITRFSSNVGNAGDSTLNGPLDTAYIECYIGQEGLAIRTMFEEATSGQARDKIGDWVLRVGIALAFVAFGVEKFPSDPNGQWVKFFDQVGVGQWFRYLTGIVEVVGGTLVLIPVTARVGLAILAATMAVASAIHVFVIHQPANTIITGGLCLGLAAFWWNRLKG